VVALSALGSMDAKVIGRMKCVGYKVSLQEWQATGRGEIDLVMSQWEFNLIYHNSCILPI